MKKKILFVVTSHDELGNTGKKTGYFLTEAGYEIDFVSPQGGDAPIDGFELDDPVNKLFWEDVRYQKKYITP